jgi:predicted transcriptional regulator
MIMKVPCEIVVWYVLPVARREIAKILVSEFKLNQREAAKKLGITEAAVSQYFSAKRGGNIHLSQKSISEIKKSAGRIAEAENTSIVAGELCMICDVMKKTPEFRKFYEMRK